MTLRPLMTACAKDYKGHSLVQTSFTEPPNILTVDCLQRYYRRTAFVVLCPLLYTYCSLFREILQRLQYCVSAYIFTSVVSLAIIYTSCSRGFACLSLGYNRDTTASIVWRLLLLGGSGGVVNSLDFCSAPLGCFYFRCVLSSQWKAVTVNL